MPVSLSLPHAAAAVAALAGRRLNQRELKVSDTAKIRRKMISVFCSSGPEGPELEGEQTNRQTENSKKPVFIFYLLAQLKK